MATRASGPSLLSVSISNTSSEEARLAGALCGRTPPERSGSVTAGHATPRLDGVHGVTTGRATGGADSTAEGCAASRLDLSMTAGHAERLGLLLGDIGEASGSRSRSGRGRADEELSECSGIPETPSMALLTEPERIARRVTRLQQALEAAERQKADYGRAAAAMVSTMGYDQVEPPDVGEDCEIDPREWQRVMAANAGSIGYDEPEAASLTQHRVSGRRCASVVSTVAYDDAGEDGALGRGDEVTPTGGAVKEPSAELTTRVDPGVSERKAPSNPSGSVFVLNVGVKSLPVVHPSVVVPQAPRSVDLSSTESYVSAEAAPVVVPQALRGREAGQVDENAGPPAKIRRESPRPSSVPPGESALVRGPCDPFRSDGGYGTLLEAAGVGREAGRCYVQGRVCFGIRRRSLGVSRGEE